MYGCEADVFIFMGNRLKAITDKHVLVLFRSMGGVEQAEQMKQESQPKSAIRGPVMPEKC